MKLSSPAFEYGGTIPARYTCDDQNICPPLTISEVPAEAQSLVLIMDDPDVPKAIRADGTWDHWVVFNIPATIREIKEGIEPEGTPGKGTGGNMDYFGPCPPDKEHRYFFKLYALDTKLDLPKQSTKQQVEKSMEGHILEKTELMGRYQRR
jgi:Raf kinase inhibitor-like YbhB/YbcL family protein